MFLASVQLRDVPSFYPTTERSFLSVRREYSGCPPGIIPLSSFPFMLLCGCSAQSTEGRFMVHGSCITDLNRWWDRPIRDETWFDLIGMDYVGLCRAGKSWGKIRENERNSLTRCKEDWWVEWAGELRSKRRLHRLLACWWNVSVPPLISYQGWHN